MAPEHDLELAIQALLDGRTLDQSHGGRPAAGSPALRAAGIVDAIARAHRAAVLGRIDLAADTPPERWGQLDIRGEVGRGASCVVYRAWDTRLQRQVALKLLDADASGADAALAEGRLLARVNHPNIVNVFGADAQDGRPGIWMELLEGDTLEDLLARGGVMSETEALLVGLDLARALGAVHGAGLLHRDVKARNVVRERGGRIVLMDLGAGRTSEASDGDRTGTPLYMAPEVLAGQPATTASDIYGLGVLLYRLLTATYPVSGASLGELRAAHAAEQRLPVASRRSALDPHVAAVVDRACAADPHERFGSAAELEAALQDALRHRLARVVVHGQVARRIARWRRTAGIVAAAATAVAAALLLTWETGAVRSARRLAGLTVPPINPLYLTVDGGLAILDGSELEIFPFNPTTAGVMAVFDDLGVRTMPTMPIRTSGAAFDLEGRLIPAPPIGNAICCFTDGTTDGAFSYSIRQDSTLLEPIGSRPLAPPGVYRFGRDWSNPELVFELPVSGQYTGLAYSRATQTFWVTKLTATGGHIEEWSADGVLLQAPVMDPARVYTAIAVDPADDTLWAVRPEMSTEVITVDNFDRSGRRLGVVEVRRLPFFGAIGAEFVWRH